MTKTTIRSALFAGAAVLAVAAAPLAAQAAVVNLTAVTQGSQNNQTAPVTQLGAAVDINVGNIVSSNIDTTVTNLSNSALDKVDVDQSASLLNGALVAQASVNNSFAPVVQAGLAVTGEGGVNLSNVTTGVLQSNNLASKATVIIQD